jgi:hypothetical protein
MSGGHLAHCTAEALAEQLGVAPVTFPGDHGGFVGRPEEFGRVLRDVLSS